MSVVVKDVTKRYGEQVALDAIGFEARKGEIMGLLGPNGAGKSTTMKILTGYLLPDSGAVEVGGRDVLANPIRTNALIGYLPEHNPLYPDMYVREYLEFAGSLQGMGGKSLRLRIEELIGRTGLTAERRKQIGQLSKGYRQRVGLAQALIHDPEVLILDEPTTGLDPNQIVEIRNLITDIGKEKTVILSTHIMQEVKAICQKVVIINRGKIVADEPIDVLSRLGAGNPELRIRFRETYNLSWIKMLEGVESTGLLPDNEICVRIQPEQEEEVRVKLFTESASRGHIILEIKREESSLETVFQQLTR